MERHGSLIDPSSPTTEKLCLLGRTVDLENSNIECEARCKVLNKELEDVKAELLRVQSIAHNTSSVSCEFPPLPPATHVSSDLSSGYVLPLLLMRGSFIPFQCAPRQGHGIRPSFSLVEEPDIGLLTVRHVPFDLQCLVSGNHCHP
ncbi:hypothetical protein FRX31_011702 [Thalictrum thalictroides]|uniref:Uncharacterized protein n=1 Tax=Thalictrum thalictroides TaxID=46969 RepID=A0A7J6WMV5_THATH|nr:hypothetical protein FRX31_011702 [Thalictrum thalictroides]